MPSLGCFHRVKLKIDAFATSMCNMYLTAQKTAVPQFVSRRNI